MFIKASGIKGDNTSYDYLKGETNSFSELVKIEKCPENESSTWCATYPKIRDIRLLNNLSININPDANGKFNINRPGFYYLTVNTEVHEEQVPISKLTLRVYKKGDNWEEGINKKELDYLDAKTSLANPHKIGIYLSSGEYQIMAKVEDNWGKYACTATPSKDFSDGQNDCGKCCKSGFIDKSQIENCFECFK